MGIIENFTFVALTIWVVDFLALYQQVFRPLKYHAVVSFVAAELTLAIIFQSILFTLMQLKCFQCLLLQPLFESVVVFHILACEAAVVDELSNDLLGHMLLLIFMLFWFDIEILRRNAFLLGIDIILDHTFIIQYQIDACMVLHVVAICWFGDFFQQQLLFNLKPLIFDDFTLLYDTSFSEDLRPVLIGSILSPFHFGRVTFHSGFVVDVEGFQWVVNHADINSWLISSKQLADMFFISYCIFLTGVVVFHFIISN